MSWDYDIDILVYSCRPIRLVQFIELDIYIDAYPDLDIVPASIRFRQHPNPFPLTQLVTTRRSCSTSLFIASTLFHLLIPSFYRNIMTISSFPLCRGLPYISGRLTYVVLFTIFVHLSYLICN